MNKKQAFEFLKQNYGGSIFLEDGLKISEWQCLNKIYHANLFGVDF